MFGIVKKKQFGIIINPVAANNRKDPAAVVRRYEKIAGMAKPPMWITSRLDDIYPIAEEFKAGGMKYLLLSGGNGTFHHVISRFKTVYQGGELPPVLMLKSGHMDTIADTINLAGNDIDILERFMRALRRGRGITLLRRNLIKIEDTYCTMFGAGGLVAQFMNHYYKMGEYTPQNALEVLTRFMTLARDASSREAREIFRPFKSTIAIDGRAFPKKEILACVGVTIPGIGLGFTPGSRVLEQSGRFQFICTALSPIDFATQIFRFYGGKKIEGPNHFDDLVESVVISSKDPFEYTMDGEMYHAIYELRIAASRTGVNLVHV